MWFVAAVLVGLAILVAIGSFHTGPHGQVVASVLGSAAAAWLVVMAIDGRAKPILWVLFSADVLVVSIVGTLAFKGLTGSRPTGSAVNRLVGADGVAITDLAPTGIVRVGGEQWSATVLNGTARAGATVQVVEASGVRLSVWRQDELESFELGGESATS